MIGGYSLRLPIPNVIALRVRRVGTAIMGREVFEEFDCRTAGAADAGDVQMCAGDIVEMLLLNSIVLTLAGNFETECVPVKLQARLGVANGDGGVIDAKEEPVDFVPFVRALAGR